MFYSNRYNLIDNIISIQLTIFNQSMSLSWIVSLFICLLYCSLYSLSRIARVSFGSRESRLLRCLARIIFSRFEALVLISFWKVASFAISMRLIGRLAIRCLPLFRSSFSLRLPPICGLIRHSKCDFSCFIISIGGSLASHRGGLELLRTFDCFWTSTRLLKLYSDDGYFAGVLIEDLLVHIVLFYMGRAGYFSADFYFLHIYWNDGKDE